MIAVIDKASEVRHTCTEALAALGQPAAAYYSTQSFVNSGAIFTSDLLILGRTRSCRTQCEALQWAKTVRPNLKTILLHPDCVEQRLLFHACESVDSLADDASVCLDVFWKALNSGNLLHRADTALTLTPSRLDLRALSLIRSAKSAKKVRNWFDESRVELAIA
jgi:hypothetical protein